MTDPIWTTMDVLAAMTVAAMFGLAVGAALPDAVRRIRAWWGSRRQRKDQETLERRLAEVWNLSDRQTALAVTAYERWDEGLCPFCGYSHLEGDMPRCEAQVAFVREEGFPTWESDLDRLLDHVFGEQRRLEVAR